ncbi:hypothetical protein MA16_Dca025323 [Dendrobium catenatum]|uniref:Uncharacterized protein n=1 Tax=Dendrobium catenatum TaxID=906689 RepID=A0A2I0VGP9_9ASPA|nr:hypothetical protein MA16_Dca025323 [Dendrobium catenatum]
MPENSDSKRDGILGLNCCQKYLTVFHAAFLPEISSGICSPTLIALARQCRIENFRWKFCKKLVAS